MYLKLEADSSIVIDTPPMKNSAILQEVVESAAHFDARWKLLGGGMHTNFLELTRGLGAQRREIVASGWYAFSSFMPRLLSLAMYRASNNCVRAQIVDVLRDELGRLPGQVIHSEMFALAVAEVGILSLAAPVGQLPNLLQGLEKSIADAGTDAEILGVLLGLEIMANENIDTLFQGIASTAVFSSTLENTDFFRIHRANEDDHIAGGIVNYEMFGIKQKDLFQNGFDRGVHFWMSFWAELESVINGLTRE